MVMMVIDVREGICVVFYGNYICGIALKAINNFTNCIRCFVLTTTNFFFTITFNGVLPKPLRSV